MELLQQQLEVQMLEEEMERAKQAEKNNKLPPRPRLSKDKDRFFILASHNYRLAQNRIKEDGKMRTKRTIITGQLIKLFNSCYFLI